MVKHARGRTKQPGEAASTDGTGRDDRPRIPAGHVAVVPRMAIQTEDEKFLMDIVRFMGTEEALCRLLLVRRASRMPSEGGVL